MGPARICFFELRAFAPWYSPCPLGMVVQVARSFYRTHYPAIRSGGTSIYIVTVASNCETLEPVGERLSSIATVVMLSAGTAVRFCFLFEYVAEILAVGAPVAVKSALGAWRGEGRVR